MGGVVNEVTIPTKVPPVGASYQLIVPSEAVAPKVTVPGPQTDPVVVLMVGISVTVTVVDTEFEHP